MGGLDLQQRQSGRDQWQLEPRWRPHHCRSTTEPPPTISSSMRRFPGVRFAITKNNVAGTPRAQRDPYLPTLAEPVLQGGVLALGNKAALGTRPLLLSIPPTALCGPRAWTSREPMPLPTPGSTGQRRQQRHHPYLGGRRDFGGTFNIELSGGGTFNSPGERQSVILFRSMTPVSPRPSAACIGGGNDNFVLDKSGIGTLVLKGNNTFDVRDSTGSGVALGQTDGISVTGGILRVAHSNALGSGDATFANVNVRGDLGAVLEIDGSGVP